MPKRKSKKRFTKKKYSTKDLQKGTRIEKKEHGFNKKISQKIARDHLKENSKYYSRKK